jgi:hypothetical protein
MGPGIDPTVGGGTRAGTAWANEDSWPKVLTFLASALKQP